MAQSTTTVARRITLTTTGTRYQSEITGSGGTRLCADEPVALGGDGTGFLPFELLSAALASCTAATLLMYARRQGWPLRHVEMAVDYVRAEERDGDSASPARDLMNRTITLIGSCDSAQCERLAAVARRCPVAKVLAGASIDVADTVTQRAAATG